MKSVHNKTAVSKNATVVGTSGAATTLTIAAIADEFHCLDSLQWSYSTVTDAVETLVITCGGTIFTMEIANSAAGTEAPLSGSYVFPHGLYSTTVNQDMVIVLRDSTTNIGTINAQYR